MRNTKLSESLLYGLLFLFFLQSLSDFIQSIYAFGLLVTAFTVEVASVVLLFTPLILLALRREPGRLFLIVLAFLAILARMVEPVLPLGGRLVACGVSVGAFMLFFPLLLHVRAPLHGGRAVSGLMLALGASALFRTAGPGIDISEQGVFQTVSWALGLLAGFLLLRVEWTGPSVQSTAEGRPVTVYAIGLASVILILYFVFVSPAVLARWTGISLGPILTVLLTGWVIFSLLWSSEGFRSRLSRPVLLGWNVVFVLLLVLSILPHQVQLPPVRDLYPIDAPPFSPLSWVLLFLMLLASPVLFLDFGLCIGQITLAKPSLRALGGGFSVAALFLLVMVFFHVFTTIYDYAPVIGPLFRDRFWLVHLLAGLGLLLPMLWPWEGSVATEEPASALPWIMAGLAALSAGAFLSNLANPPQPGPSSQLKVMTYNIQQGFDRVGNQDLEGQLAVIRAVEPDILGLQESDTARVANGNVDTVRFFADRLDMYSYYGPTTITGTFGIALLSRYPLEDPSTFYMYSEGEQTASIQAGVYVDGHDYQVFVTHLGNDGPIFQLQDLLERIDGLENVIAMGDFNFRPATDQYALMTRRLEDSWLLKWPGGREIPGYSPEKRIDHIFVSPGTRVLESEYVVDPASDHPYMFTIIQP